MLFVVIVLASATAYAAVDLEWRAAEQTVVVGDTVEVGLYAVYTPAYPDYGPSITSLKIILEWDSDSIELIGNVDNGDYSWMSSGFAPDPYGLNSTFLDGNALYKARTPLGSDNCADATQEGLLVTTMQFRAVAGTEGAVLSISEELSEAYTVVFPCVQGAGNGLGTRGSAMFTIERAIGDMNCDGSINSLDIDLFTLALADPDVYEAAYPDCDINNADINGDSMINSLDIDPFIEMLD